MKTIIYIIKYFLLLGCNCNEIPLNFKTYEQVVTEVENSTFNKEETTKIGLKMQIITVVI